MPNVDTVRGFLSAMEAMNYDLAMPLLSPEIRYTNGPKPEVIGPSAVLDELEPFFSPIEENQFVIERIVSDDSTVIVQRLDKHRLPQGWFELPVTGVFEVHDGQITYWREYFDLNTIVTQMTALMETSKGT